MSVRRFVSACAPLFFVATALSVTGTPAFAQETPDLARQAQNPIASLISVPFQNNFNFDTGSKEDLQNVLNIEPVIPFQISNRWNLVTRTIVPLIHQPEFGPGIGNVSGLGDVQFSMFLSPVHTARSFGLSVQSCPFPRRRMIRRERRSWASGPRRSPSRSAVRGSSARS